MDQYKVYGEIKNYTVPLMYKNFVVTSNYTIEELFANEPKMIEPIRRRCKVIHFTKEMRSDYKKPETIQEEKKEEVDYFKVYPEYMENEKDEFDIDLLHNMNFKF